jgi:hypothetical protein
VLPGTLFDNRHSFLSSPLVREQAAQTPSKSRVFRLVGTTKFNLSL